ncbi:MAG: hypothetical protein H6883_01445 [Rhodobiaceae bacterium]|nr:hypothetical protein [Rhodobiaceae bacterium]MCC0054782.1 hypothetical protein [Rhodobiaceae bacterium]
MQVMRAENYGASAERAGEPEWSTVNAVTGLSTDYLNHFNEAIMLFGLAPDVPECLDDLQHWAPVSYEAHFARSGLKERFHAIEAYRECATGRRQMFDLTIAELSAILIDGIARLRPEMEAGEHIKASMYAGEAIARARELVDQAAGIVNGHGSYRDDPEETPEDDPQALADKLFD